ncbi:TRAP transporter large permease [Allopusillimonas soli]|uniref:TRAP transporter large permease protein n=1 Tax=Allopusillimonas soli TaxID=659016 RepID=A0A853FBX2_9BURK|nr:TRAP transporter large permease [Allopusillimonas soli]TEA74888.1 TRAP transporter large permease [Allopusillimonas soli]
MPVEVIGVIGVVSMFVLMFLRVPIAIAMAVPGIVGTWYLRGWTPTSTILNTVIWNHSYSYALTTIPMFVLMSELIFISGISADLFSVFRKWLGAIRGGLALTTVGASAIFAAACGSSIASTATIGIVASKEMQKAGYSDSLSSGSVVAGGTLGILIPPSTAFIIYGILTEESIGKLLIAGILPGVLLTLLYMATVYCAVLVRPSLGPAVERSSWRERISALRSIVWIAVLFVIVIGGMYAGLLSPTEAAGFGALGALVIAWIRRRMTWRNFATSLHNTIKITSFLFAIMLGAFILNYFLAITRLPANLATFINGLDVDPIMILLVILAIYVFLGAIMDALAMVVITIPIFLPMLHALGFDLIWFGVIVVIMIEMALISPPVGMGCFVLKGVNPSLSMGSIYKGALLFMLPIFVLLGLLIAFPDIALVLPRLMR